jgi:hypothetical protein
VSYNKRHVAAIRRKDRAGKPIVLVQVRDVLGLTKHNKSLPSFAVLDADDFDRIQTHGHSLRWSFNASDAAATWAYVRVHLPGVGKRMVSHLVAMPPKGCHVKHHDGNPLNLRRANLYIEGGGRTKGDVRHVESYMQDFATNSTARAEATTR